MELRVPAPCLLVLVGPSASGKSTWAAAHFRANEIVSSDALRAAVGIDERDRRAGTAAFDLLEQIITERLARRLTTVVDTLGFDDERRRSWIERAHTASMPAYAIVFDTPGAVCEERNDARDRPIPKSVLRKQITRMRAVRAHLAGDGFDAIHTEQPIAAVAPSLVGDGPPRGPITMGASTFGLVLNRFDWPGDTTDRAGQLATVASRAEAAGFTDLWVMDHFRQIPSIGREWEEMPESYTTLAYLAGITSKIRLGVLVSGVTYRNPAHLGKIVATLDVLSGGRALCGVGLGWHRTEHEAYGWEFPPVAARYDLLDDTLRLLPLLWGKGAPVFEGKTFRASGLMCYPRPIQERIPILVGGSGPRRTLRLAAEHADMCNLFGEPDRVRELVAVLADHCTSLGRDPARVTVTNLTSALVAPDRRRLERRIDELRPRDVGADQYAARYHAGTVADHIARMGSFAAAGVQHPMVSMPDVHLEGSIEAFADVMAGMATRRP
jgi:F420-dependent oxidoreductase-like protein